MISYTKIKDQIKQKLTLKDIIDFYVGYNNIGANGRLKCPFNLQEKHHNFEVKNKMWRCYYCNESGDEIAFVQKLFGLTDYKDALMRIADDFNLSTDFSHDEKYVKEMTELRKQRDKEKEFQLLFKKSEMQLFVYLVNYRNFLEKKMKMVEPYNTENLGQYRYTELAEQFIHYQKKYDTTNTLIAIICQDDVDFTIYQSYNINMDDPDYKTKLKDKIVFEYMQKKGLI